LSFGCDKNEKDDRNDWDWWDRDDRRFKWPEHADRGQQCRADDEHNEQREFPVRTHGKDDDPVRQTPPGKLCLDAERLDKYLRDFDRTTGNSAGDIDYSARWQAVSRAMADDLASFDDDMQLNKKHGADVSSFGQTTVGETGSLNACGIDGFSLVAGSGANLKSFKGLQEGMARVG
jgi:hypothetical protein